MINQHCFWSAIKKAISILDARSHKLFLGIYNEGKVIVDDCLINIDEFEKIIESIDYK